MTMSLKAFSTLKRLMQLATSDNDAEALAALRKANSLLQAAGVDWQRVFELAAVDGHSISWGVNGSAGLYDPTAAELDEAAFANDTLHCTSAGNSGPAGLMGSPATMKNVARAPTAASADSTAAVHR